MSLLLLSRSRDDDAACRQREEDLILFAATSGHDVLIVPHLYHLPEDAALWSRLAGLAREGRAVAVCAWMHPRPIQILLENHDSWGALHRAFNLALGASTDLWAELAPALGSGSGGTTETVAADATARWYPLIDSGRCTQCRQCQQFCLFGVFSLDTAGQVVVTQPGNCKPGCPACSRVCPESAIVFPLHQRDPAIAGAPGHLLSAESVQRAWQERKFHLAAAGGGGPAKDDGLDALIADLDRLPRKDGNGG